MVMEYQYYQEVASVTSFFVRKEIHFAMSARQVHVLVYGRLRKRLWKMDVFMSWSVQWTVFTIKEFATTVRRWNLTPFQMPNSSNVLSLQGDKKGDKKSFYNCCSSRWAREWLTIAALLIISVVFFETKGCLKKWSIKSPLLLVDSSLEFRYKF